MDAENIDSHQVLWDDGERIFCKILSDGAHAARYGFMAALSAGENPSPEAINRLTREYGLKDYLDSAWAVRPLQLIRERGRILLIVDYLGGEPLDRLISAPMEMGQFLRLSAALSATIGRLHGRGLIHKDIKPPHVLVNPATNQVWLTGFGIASRLLRERPAPNPPEIIAGTLAYMAPEQTGRMNRSIDSRSDLYSLGVTLYEMLTGGLPFTADGPMEWVHCHIARQPVSPDKRIDHIPPTVSAIIMKLLAKTAEERYQSAVGVESDLRRCLSEWETQRRIGDFALGAHDIPNRLMIPEKLYGRECEIDALLTAFDRIVAGGKPELVLVSGYAGIGKSAVVNELHKSLVPRRGLFASGKFDQYKRDIPYATLAQAFQCLIRPLLSKGEEDLHQWRDALHKALDPNALLIVELVPELKHIIGEPPQVPELPAQDAQGRLQLTIRRFISVFASADHPLAVFLDDLQWLDAATLDLLEDLLAQTDLKHVLLVGAYRDNEVNCAHPLMRKLDAMRQAGSVLQDIVLAPLGPEYLGQLLADSFRCELDRVAPLAQLIHAKTIGNPFFTIQFISTLADEGLLTFDYDQVQWSWDLNRIQARGYTDNVVDLMVGKLNRLPVDTQKALQQFACLGSSATFDMLQVVYEDSIEDMHGQLWEAVRTGLIFRSETSYRFLHDRVQEAAYSLISKGLRAQAHLRIGNLLAKNTPPGRRDESIFEIVNQLNRGLHLIVSTKEREQVAALNLAAARRAKVSTALVSALKYLEAGRSLLTEKTWEINYDLIFSIESLMAECELLAAEMVEAEKRLTMLSGRAKPGHDFAAVTRLKLTLYTTLDRSELAIEAFLDYLRRCGTDWSKHPTRHEVISEYDRIWSLVGKRQIEDLVELPPLTDPDVIDMLDVFTEIVHPAMFYDENLSSLAVCRMVNLSLEHGNGDGSCFGYVWFAMFAGPRFNNYKDGFRFGQVGYDLVETRGITRYQARTYITFSTLTPWARHASNARELVRRAFDIAYRVGDLTFSAYSWHVLITNYLVVGDHLEVVQAEAETGLAFAKQQGFGLVAANCGAQLGLIRTLRGVTRSFGRFDDQDYNESESERYLASNPGLALAEFFYWTRKLQGRFFAGEYEAAVGASRRAHSLLWPAASQVETGDFRFYGALAHAAAWNSASAAEKQLHFEALIEHHRQLEIWAEHCPANFENRAALVSAEIARIEGQLLEAERLYEKAIQSSQANRFIHNEAVASEVAAQFYEARGFTIIANAYVRNARAAYEQWGAQGKVNQIDARFPHLQALSTPSVVGATIETPVARMDAETVISASQTLSREMTLPSLIEKLLCLAVEHSGAQRGLLILLHDEEPHVEAKAQSGDERVEIVIRHERVKPTDLPQSVLQFVLRTREQVLHGDACSQPGQLDDEYIRDNRPRSLLCLPILKQSTVIGALYLENRLTAHAFTPGRVAVLGILASQAAISLENAHLYRELQEREARVRRLVDSNIIGICIFNLDRRIMEANEAFLRIVGYSRDDVISGRLSWTSLSPPESREADERALADLVTTGTYTPYENNLLRKDGSRVPVLVGGATFGELRHQGVAFVVDLTELKRAEEGARNSERQYHEIQLQLAHANRVKTVEHLSASIAHELNQPLSGVLVSAETALLWLSGDQPNVPEAQKALARVVRDGNRTSEVFQGIRALIKKAPPQKERLDINEVILDILGLTRGEAAKNQVLLRTQLQEALPLIECDRVHLQQVTLNLIMNALDALNGCDNGAREILISTAKSDSGDVQVCVQDSGSGIDPMDIERIFNAFYTTKPNGLGMGLSICRSIIEAHGGRLWATTSASRGAVFQFTVPVDGAPPTPRS